MNITFHINIIDIIRTIIIIIAIIIIMKTTIIIIIHQYNYY